MHIISAIRSPIHFSAKHMNHCFKELFINADNVNTGS